MIIAMGYEKFAVIERLSPSCVAGFRYNRSSRIQKEMAENREFRQEKLQFLRDRFHRKRNETERSLRNLNVDTTGYFPADIPTDTIRYDVPWDSHNFLVF